LEDWPARNYWGEIMAIEEQLKQEVQQVLARYGYKDFILLYAEGEKIKGVAEVGLSLLGPFLAKSILGRIIK
jgi:hypothetical protein